MSAFLLPLLAGAALGGSSTSVSVSQTSANQIDSSPTVNLAIGGGVTSAPFRYDNAGFEASATSSASAQAGGGGSLPFSGLVGRSTALTGAGELSASGGGMSKNWLAIGSVILIGYIAYRGLST